MENMLDAVVWENESFKYNLGKLIGNIIQYALDAIWFPSLYKVYNITGEIR